MRSGFCCGQIEKVAGNTQSSRVQTEDKLPTERDDPTVHP